MTKTYEGKTREIVCTFEYDGNKLVRCVKYTDDKLSSQRVCDGSLDRVLSEVYYTDGKEEYRNDYEYDRNGNRVLSVAFFQGEETSRTVSRFDEKGNLIRSESLPDGSYTIREYDETGNEIRMVSYEEGAEVKRGETRYDDHGRVVESAKYFGGELAYRYTYEYNNQGDVTKTVTEGLEETCEYTYDTNGRKLTATRYENGELSTHASWQYDADGNITEYVLRSADEEVERNVYTYEQGRLISEIWYRHEEKSGAKTCSYDSHGCMTGYTIEEDGVSTLTIQYDHVDASPEEAEAFAEILAYSEQFLLRFYG